MSNLFTYHPASVGESYSEHARFAAGCSLKLLTASCAAAIHAVLPFLCVKTASQIIDGLHHDMVTHRIKNAEKLEELQRLQAAE